MLLLSASVKGCAELLEAGIFVRLFGVKKLQDKWVVDGNKGKEETHALYTAKDV